jgi:geranylgeranyl reductase family protein
MLFKAYKGRFKKESQTLYKMRVYIIGGGPIGSYTAYLLARQGYNVEVFEEHTTIGEPVQCTGIVTSALAETIKLDKEFIPNKITKTRIFSPDNSFIELSFPKGKENIVLDRAKFDRHIASMAKDVGVKFHLGSKFVGRRNNIIIIEGNMAGEHKADYIIGADGPTSKVAKSSGMFKKRKFWTGLQARVKLKNNNIVEFYPHIGSFAWVVPEDKETVRMGLLAKNNIKETFNDFLKKRLGNYTIIDQQAGLVPIYSSQIKTQKGNTFLVGDAACMVKATTGGGIVQGLKAAKALAYSIKNNKNYEKAWKKEIGKELWLSLMIRRCLDNFSDKDYNNLVSLFNKEKTSRILEEHDRDYPSKFLFKLLLAEPRLMLFARKLI